MLRNSRGVPLEEFHDTNVLLYLTNGSVWSGKFYLNDENTWSINNETELYSVALIEDIRWPPSKLVQDAF